MIHNALGFAIVSMVYFGFCRFYRCNVLIKEQAQFRLIIASISMIALSALIYFFYTEM